ncbi:glycoside hydrolase/deacetylase [Pholiota conissans]|uniref:chitin deacetylase n=1 Tax=Pholiota conissans TaxID=109636 RepID=A0A9P5YW84_9AGAR|nr:glycoside hydrolase/deacetylase [Pholiota conissans]
MLLVSPKTAPMLRRFLTLGVVTVSLSRVVAQTQDAPMPDLTQDAAAGDSGAVQDGTSSVGDECDVYYYEPVANALASFPNIWDQATILSEDTNALAKWASIQPNVPDISTKGTPTGDFSNITYSSDDPDCWWTATKCNEPKVANVPSDVAIMDEPHTLGFGFDDGPNCSHNAFYDYLKAHNQKATMFFIGSNVMDWPLETARALNDGHELCVHGWSHRYMTSLESTDAFAELYYSMEAIKLVAGVTPTCWRPPFGDVDDRIRAIATGLGLRTVLWAYDSQDWQVGSTAGFTAEQVDKEYGLMIEDASKGAFNNTGTMILMHELNEFTMNQAMKYYPKLKDVFKHIVPVATGLNITHPYVEDGYTMQNFAEHLASTGALLIANGTNATMSAAPSESATQISTSPEVTNQLDNIKKTAEASGMSSNAILTFALSLICLAMM